MTRSFPLVTGCTALLVLGLGQSTGSDSLPTGESDLATTRQALRDTSVPFVPNLGQWDHRARFIHRTGPMSLLLEDRGWMIGLTELADTDRDPFATEPAKPDPETVLTVALRMSFEGANEAPRLSGEERLPGHHNYFLGDRQHWRTEVPLYAAVRYRGLYPGIDLCVRNRDGHPEYDLLLQPRADLDAVSVRVEGGDGLRIDDDGSLVIDTALGPITQPMPRTWQTSNGNQTPVRCKYVLRASDRFGFEAEEWDAEQALVIDPGLLWSTYLGGGGNEDLNGITTTAAGLALAVGQAVANDFPTTAGVFKKNYGGSNDGYVTCLDPSKSKAAQLVYSTYFGGNRNDSVYSVHVDANDLITITGFTESNPFATTPGAFASAVVGDQDAFVAQLNPNLTGSAQLVFSSLLGGTDKDRGYAVSANASGIIAVTGDTRSVDFPVTADAWNPNYILDDVFIACFDPALTGAAQLTYSTYTGGTDVDTPNAMHIAANGLVTVVGQTLSVDFPTTLGSLYTFYQGGAEDGFISQFDPSRVGKSQLVYSSFIGGSNRDHVLDLDVHPSGLIALSGWTWSTNFRTTTGAWDRRLDGLSDSYVCLLAPFPIGTTQLVYSTFFGGTGHEQAHAIKIHSDLGITLAGETRSLDFPTTPGAFASALKGSGSTPPADCWVARLDATLPTTRQLTYSTLFGGDKTDTVQAVTINRIGYAIIGGQSTSPNFPLTPNPLQRTKVGSRDVVVAMLDMLPTGVTGYGAGTAGCDGQRAISVTAQPTVGNVDFAITGSEGPVTSQGLLVLGAAARQTPLTLANIDLWVETVTPRAIVIPVQSNQYGSTRLPLPIPFEPLLAGTSVYAQIVWIDFSSTMPICTPQGFSATHALQIDIQP